MKNGGSQAALVKSELPSEVILNSPDDGVAKIKREEIQKGS